MDINLEFADEGKEIECRRALVRTGSQSIDESFEDWIIMRPPVLHGQVQGFNGRGKVEDIE